MTLLMLILFFKIASISRIEGERYCHLKAQRMPQSKTQNARYSVDIRIILNYIFARLFYSALF